MTFSKTPGDFAEHADQFSVLARCLHRGEIPERTLLEETSIRVGLPLLSQSPNGDEVPFGLAQSICALAANDLVRRSDCWLLGLAPGLALKGQPAGAYVVLDGQFRDVAGEWFFLATERSGLAPTGSIVLGASNAESDLLREASAYRWTLWHTPELSPQARRRRLHELAEAEDTLRAGDVGAFRTLYSQLPVFSSVDSAALDMFRATWDLLNCLSDGGVTVFAGTWKWPDGSTRAMTVRARLVELCFQLFWCPYVVDLDELEGIASSLGFACGACEEAKRWRTIHRGAVARALPRSVQSLVGDRALLENDLQRNMTGAGFDRNLRKVLSLLGHPCPRRTTEAQSASERAAIELCFLFLVADRPIVRALQLLATLPSGTALRTASRFMSLRRRTVDLVMLDADLKAMFGPLPPATSAHRREWGLLLDEHQFHLADVAVLPTLVKEFSDQRGQIANEDR